MPAEPEPGRTGALLGALLWRLRRERLRYLALALIPFAATTALTIVLPTVTGGAGVNGVDRIGGFGLRYGTHAGTLAVSIVLMIAPGLVALFSAIGVASIIRNLVGGEASRGGLEELLATPHSPAAIATALLSVAAGLATTLWAAMTALGALAVALTVLASRDSATVSGAYLAVALILPLLAAWAGAGLSLMVNLLFPRLAQLGKTSALVNGGGLGNGLALLPALGVFLTMSTGAGLGPTTFLLTAGLATAAIAAGSVAAVARGFRPEAVLES
ncbi:hypothetical protein GCM10023322_74310 [Rugosimonospora acidiphila]|uniref:ABC transporter permease n=1 Tax=Rugosimonospora acidiphila TaxID=556531 RepID=A0ABP9SML2_9ACTN